MSHSERVISTKRSPRGTYTHACEQSHENLQPYADDAQRITVESQQADLLRWHYHIGHLSFKIIKAMAEVGLLPKKLAKALVPKYVGCMFATIIKKPWRTKGRNTCGQVGKILKITRPGQCISVDMLEPPQVGFIDHMKGRLTKERYRYSTLFVDHFSDLKYTHCMSEITSEETINAKKRFEILATGFNLRVEHYHCNHGQFSDNTFLQHC